MSLKEDIQEKIKQSMKEGDSEKLSTLRMLWSAIRNEEIDKKADLKDEEVEAVVVRQVKQLKDGLKDFEAGGREDLASQSREEIKILSAYLPEQLSEEAIIKIVNEVLESLDEKEGVQIGVVMGSVMKKIKGQVDGALVRKIVTEKLS